MPNKCLVFIYTLKKKEHHINCILYSCQTILSQEYQMHLVCTNQNHQLFHLPQAQAKSQKKIKVKWYIFVCLYFPIFC